MKRLLLLAVLTAAAHAQTTPFPQPINTERTPGGPMPAAEAAAQMKMPPGFRCTAFAAEPDVQQPIAMTTDARGRLWVAECYVYDRDTFNNPNIRDRIVILEDMDNDGRFDRRTVFWDGAERLSSIEIGTGGVWALCLPNLVFIPDANGDDVPDAAPEVVLDGFDFQHAAHTVANGLRWGPDGWLYGRQGILGTSHLGKPGTPDAERIAMNVGIWRFHPLRRKFEVVAQGTTNPWGMDWDAKGEAFFINTVIGHLWHVIPGAHYRRMFGDDPNPRIYELIEQHADHVHWATGEAWADIRKGVTDATSAAGGGHAHSGLMIYQGGQWPAEWAGKLLTVNFHGRRMNVERLERTGSGFTGRAEPDAFFSPDAWFRGIDLIAAPDGGVFVSDWSDAGECHDNDGVHRTSGRIFKITHGQPGPRTTGDLAQLSSAQLAALQLSPNDWLARQSRRVLAARAEKKSDLADAVSELRRIVAEDKDTVHRLRALWGLHVAQRSDLELLVSLLADGDEAMRAWAVRLLEDQSHTDATSAARFARVLAEQLPAFAEKEPSALVRLTLASLVNALPVAQRAPLAAALLTHAEDDADHNLPLVLWAGVEPLAGTPGVAFEKLIAEARLARVQRFGARRLTEEIESAPARLDAVLAGLAENSSPASRQAVLDGIADGLIGRRKVAKPAAWDRVSAALAKDATEPLRSRLRDLSAAFGDGRALDEIRVVALNKNADLRLRRVALKTLIEARPPWLREVCEPMLHERDLSADAASGLALSDDPAVAAVLLAEWPKLYGSERPAVIAALVSRPAWAALALDAIAGGPLKRDDLSVLLARQIHGYNDDALNKKLAAVWGEVTALNAAEKAAALAQWKARLNPDALAKADQKQGRVLFTSICGACHQLNGQGGAIGPDLTGSDRGNLDYLLGNILDPSAVVADAYRQTTLTLKDGRVFVGVIRTRNAQTLTLQTVTETTTVPLTEIAAEKTSALSLMPEGLLDALGEENARHLLAFLMNKNLPAAPADGK